MEEKHIYEGKTTTEAIEKGLKDLNVSKNDVEVIIIKDEEKRSFFSILDPRVVKVELKIKDLEVKKEKVVKEKEKKEISEEALIKATRNVEDFLNTFLKQISNDVEYKIYNDKYYIYIDILGENTNSLIGYRGDVLNALQTLITSIANKNIEEKIRIILDISGYREKRKKVLEELAEKVAKTVVKTRKKVVLEPMSAYERKVIHSKLQNNKNVTTESIGEEPNRKIVVLLKK